jgi:hypothetical protein
VAKLRVEERRDLRPVCPHCEQELDIVLARALSSSLFSKRLIYCCPHCRKVLGVTHRKGLLAQ